MPIWHLKTSCSSAVSGIQNCVDQQARSHVNDETILDDIQTVYDFASAQPSLNSNGIVLLGHSEGTLNISRLVGRGSVPSASE